MIGYVWHDIKDAPKDGRKLLIGWMDRGEIQEFFTMVWDDAATNRRVTYDVGMWVAPDGSFTWVNSGEGAPTHFAHLVN